MRIALLWVLLIVLALAVGSDQSLATGPASGQQQLPSTHFGTPDTEKPFLDGAVTGFTDARVATNPLAPEVIPQDGLRRPDVALEELVADFRHIAPFGDGDAVDQQADRLEQQFDQAIGGLAQCLYRWLGLVLEGAQAGGQQVGLEGNKGSREPLLVPEGAIEGRQRAARTGHDVAQPRIAPALAREFGDGGFQHQFGALLPPGIEWSRGQRR